LYNIYLQQISASLFSVGCYLRILPSDSVTAVMYGVLIQICFTLWKMNHKSLSLPKEFDKDE